jgi:hypothetical protein
MTDSYLLEIIKQLEQDAVTMRLGYTPRDLADIGRDIHTISEALLEKLEVKK